MKVRKVEVLVCLLPACSILGIVYFYPVISLFYYSVMSYGAWKTSFMGLENFRLILTDSLFYTALINNLRLLIVVVIFVPLCLVIAILIFGIKKGGKIYLPLTFVPYIIAIPVSGIILSILLTDGGFVNSFLRNVKLNFLALSWLGSPTMAINTLGAIIIWNQMGFGILVCFARLLGIDQTLFDAASIDGATWWHRLRWIVIPELSAVLRFLALISVINILSWLFTYVYVITRGGPGGSTNVLPLYIYTITFRQYQIGQGCAAALILLGIVSVAIFYLQFLLRERF